MRRGRKLEPIVLTSEENNRLLEWTRRQKTSQALALRARIVLACQQDRSNRDIGREVRATAQTVGKWRSRFQRLRLDGLLDEPRPGVPRTISDEQVERVVAKTEAPHFRRTLDLLGPEASLHPPVDVVHAVRVHPNR